jgi:hypothetical protein
MLDTEFGHGRLPPTPHMDAENTHMQLTTINLYRRKEIPGE